MALHEKRCELCGFYYTNTYFNNLGMSNKCLDVSAEGVRPITPPVKDFIDSRGCATFKAGVPRANIFYSVTFNDGMMMRDYGKAETADGAEKLKVKMVAENIKEGDIRITKVISEGIELSQIALDSAAEIAARTP
jgi:hypothetical protein